MPKDRQIEAWNKWRKEREELNKLKKEMVERVVEKMKESNSDLALLVWKDIVADYLVDEWWNDRLHDFFLGLGLNIFSGCSEQLKDLREKISQTKSKKELNDLEKTIIESLWKLSDDKWNNSQRSTKSTTSRTAATTRAAASTTYSSRRRDNIYSRTSTESAPVWEAAEIPVKDRMNRLFPEWKPKSPEEMKKYIIPINVPIRTPKWKSDNLTLYIHKKLANEYQAIFQEMYDKRIPVNPKKTGWYNWRPMRNWRKQSHHSYWSAVDVNWDVNGWVHGSTVRNSPYFNSKDTVAIWKRHGFYWWWDWSKGQNDPMHFTYMNA